MRGRYLNPIRSFSPIGVPAMRRPLRFLLLCAALTLAAFPRPAAAQKTEPVDAEGQPLAGNADRLLQALEFLGHPLSEETIKALRPAIKMQNARKIQELLDPQVLFQV